MLAVCSSQGRMNQHAGDIIAAGSQQAFQGKGRGGSLRQRCFSASTCRPISRVLTKVLSAVVSTLSPRGPYTCMPYVGPITGPPEPMSDIVISMPVVETATTERHKRFSI